MNIITFPNLNIGPLVIDPVAFTLFGRNVAWYGVIITLGIICAVAYVLFCAKREKLLEDDVYDYALITVLCGIICARLYYVVFDPDPHYESFADVIAIWNGGLAIYGGIIGGALAILLVSKVKKIHFMRIADIAAPAVVRAQAMGRWGNFTNGEAYGSVEKFDFFFFSFDISESFLTSPFLMNVNGINAQPTFLYESVWNLIGFVLLVTIVHKRRAFAGMTMLSYFAWYGFGRMFIEGLRTDSLYIPGSDTMRVSQLIAFLTFALSACAIVLLSVRAKKHPFDASEPMYYGAKLQKLRKAGLLSDDTVADDTSTDIIEDAESDDNEKSNDTQMNHIEKANDKEKEE